MKKKDNKGKNKPQRAKRSWAARVLAKLSKPEAALQKVHGMLAVASAPGVVPGTLATALISLNETVKQLEAVPADWKPARAGKGGITVGSVIKIKDDYLKEYGTLGEPALWTGATVKQPADFDKRYWLVTCKDGVTRMIRKKHAVLVA